MEQERRRLKPAGEEGEGEEGSDHPERKQRDDGDSKCAFHILFIISLLMSLNEPPTFLPGLKRLRGSKIFFVRSKSATISVPKSIGRYGVRMMPSLCSPVVVPPARITSSYTLGASSRMTLRFSSFVRSIRGRMCRLPSPIWPATVYTMFDLYSSRSAESFGSKSG